MDVTGPAEVFAAAARQVERDVYRVELASVGGGLVTTSSGLSLGTRDLMRVRPRASDTLVVSGGGDDAVRAALDDRKLMRWLAAASRVVARLASVCSGAFILAALGVLDGKRVATHWSACELLARFRPQATVDKNAIFVREGNIWTSAGVTTGIDMSLAMVEQDLGRDVADAVAARLVLYVRRPGFQSQFSEVLVAQTRASDPLGAAVAWVRAHIHEADVDLFARKAGLSLRTFYRRCLTHAGTTPARLLDKLRVEHARNLLSTTVLPAKALAAQCGFATSARMRRAFDRELGIGPREYRLLFS